MIARPASSRFSRLVLEALVVSFLAAGAARAQDRNLALDWTNTDKERTRELLQTMTELRNGERQPAGDNDAKAIAVIARWYVYQLAGAKIGEPKVVERLFIDFDADLLAAAKHAETNKAFRQQYAKQVAVHVKNVVDDKKVRTISHMNAVRMLAHLAKDAQEDVADELAEVLESQTIDDGSRYWAARALRDLFAAGEFKDKKRQVRCIVALLGQLKRRYTVPADPSLNPDPEILKHVEGICYYRREVIRALGESRYPAIEGPDKTLVRTAQELLRVTRNEDLMPAARLDERAEAAIGVAKLQPGLYKGYQPDYAAQQIAGFVLIYSDAFLNPSQLPRFGRDVDRTKEVARYYAFRLADALKGMADSKDLKEMAKDNAQKPVVEYVTQTCEACVEVLVNLGETGGANARSTLQERQIDKLPPNRTLYKGVADSGFGAELKAQDPTKPPEK